jgi:phosphopantothenoylcysteine decarboxylase / phosphopantothenate---cysteine ligase
MNILLGVTGGIAAYKSCEFCSLAIKAGHQIQVVQTQNASRFVGTITFEGLTGRRVLNNTFEAAMDHIEWAKWADVVVVAPLSANTLAKIAHGLCDDLLSTTICATPKQTPILLCPAMNTHMWIHPLTQRNVDILTATKRFDWQMPVEKRLACGDVGVGGLANPVGILQHCESLC